MIAHNNLPSSGVWKAEYESEFYRLLPKKKCSTKAIGSLGKACATLYGAGTADNGLNVDS